MMDLLVPDIRQGENNRTYAHRVLRMNIMAFRLKPGEILNEAAIAQLLSMSRTPVHEALIRLSEEWLVDIFPQKGTRVSRIDPSLVKEGYSTRLLLETAILQDEAGKVSRGQVQQLLTCLHRQEQAGIDRMESVDDFILLDDEFHRMMYYFGGRSHTWKSIRGLVSHYDRLRYLDALEGNVDREKVLSQHREFCDYLLMGLPDSVEPDQKIRDHLTSFRGDLLNKIAAHPDYFTLED